TGMDLFIRPDFLVPVMMGPRLLGVGENTLSARDVRADEAYSIKGRLKSGLSTPAASADIDAIAKEIGEAYPDPNRRGVSVRTELQSRLDANPTLSGVVAAVFGLMVVILLIACANVMNLMLGHGRSRAREIAIRLSLGAGRFRVIRQLMVESLMIA